MQQGALTVSGAIGDQQTHMVPSVAVTPQAQAHAHAAAVAQLLQGQGQAQLNVPNPQQVQPAAQAPTQLNELYRLLLTQGRRVHYSSIDGSQGMPPQPPKK